MDDEIITIDYNNLKKYIFIPLYTPKFINI